MPNCAVNGDSVNGGFIVAESYGNPVYVNGKLVALVGNIVLPHPPDHNSQRLITGSFNVFINGESVCRYGDLASCGHAIDFAQNNDVFING